MARYVLLGRSLKEKNRRLYDIPQCPIECKPYRDLRRHRSSYEYTAHQNIKPPGMATRDNNNGMRDISSVYVHGCVFTIGTKRMGP